MRLFLAILFSICVVFIGLFSCKRSGSKNKYSNIKVGGSITSYTLTDLERAEFGSMIMRLSSGREWISDAPDMVFYGYRAGRDKPDEYSIFLKAGVIYKGFFLDAFSERMYDKKSKILVIDNMAKDFFERIKKAQGIDESSWRTDKAPIEKRIPLLVPFEECIWQGGQASNNSGRGLPAPEEYFVRGFIKIDEPISKALQAKYPWNSVSFDKTSIDKPSTSSPVDSFLAGGDYLESSDFMREQTKQSSSSNGRMIFSPTARVIYFDLQNL